MEDITEFRVLGVTASIFNTDLVYHDASSSRRILSPKKQILK